MEEKCAPMPLERLWELPAIPFPTTISWLSLIFSSVCYSHTGPPLFHNFMTLHTRLFPLCRLPFCPISWRGKIAFISLDITQSILWLQSAWSLTPQSLSTPSLAPRQLPTHCTFSLIMLWLTIHRPISSKRLKSIRAVLFVFHIQWSVVSAIIRGTKYCWRNEQRELQYHLINVLIPSSSL